MTSQQQQPEIGIAKDAIESVIDQSAADCKKLLSEIPSIRMPTRLELGYMRPLPNDELPHCGNCKYFHPQADIESLHLGACGLMTADENRTVHERGCCNAFDYGDKDVVNPHRPVYASSRVVYARIDAHVKQQQQAEGKKDPLAEKKLAKDDPIPPRNESAQRIDQVLHEFPNVFANLDTLKWVKQDDGNLFAELKIRGRQTDDALIVILSQQHRDPPMCVMVPSMQKQTVHIFKTVGQLRSIIQEQVSHSGVRA